MWIESFANREKRFRKNAAEKKENLLDYLMEMKE